MHAEKIGLMVYAARELAHLYAAEGIDTPEQFIFTRSEDGMDIPPSTAVRVTVELLHKPDPEVTPVLSAEELVGV